MSESVEVIAAILVLVRHRFKLFAGFFLLNATIHLYIYS